MRNFTHCFGRFGNLFKHFIYPDPANSTAVVIVEDSNGNPLSSVAVQIKSVNGDYMYTATTDANGEVSLRGTIGHIYRVVLAKSGINQYEIHGWTFHLTDTLEYPQETKTIWDGMHADTSTQMYVDTHDGENA